VPGLLRAAQVRETAAAIVEVQQDDGGIPWAVGEHIDVWNHVEAAMALLVGGETQAAEAAYSWCLANQRADGSWPMKIIGDRVEDASGDTNMSAYLAVGVWHHWLLRRDSAWVEDHWPAVRAGLDFVVGLQLPYGGIAWSQQADGVVNRDALLAGSSSIYHSLRAGLAIADLLGDPQPSWELAAGRLRHALAEHRDLFLDKSEFSMDWYYPVLAGPVRGAAAAQQPVVPGAHREVGAHVGVAAGVLDDVADDLHRPRAVGALLGQAPGVRRLGGLHLAADEERHRRLDVVPRIDVLADRPGDAAVVLLDLDDRRGGLADLAGPQEARHLGGGVGLP
jgi:hypothetical protein